MENFDDYLSNEKSKRYEITGRLGEGSFGEVRDGIDLYTKCRVAMKFVKIISRDNSGIPKAICREIESLRHLSSLYVCNLLDVYPDESNLVLVLEYLPSDLSEVILQAGSHLIRSHFKSYAYMLLKAIYHCHSKGIMHRDIKPSNILLSVNGQLKLGDFGLARIYEAGSNQSLSFQVATRWYRPPELLYASRHYDFSMDIWSIGTVLAELLLLSPLFPGNNDIDQMFKVFQIMGTPTTENWPGVENLPDFDKIFFQDMKPIPLRVIMPQAHIRDLELLQQLLQLNPSNRRSASELLKDVYFFEMPLPAPPFELAPPMRQNDRKGGGRYSLDARQYLASKYTKNNICNILSKEINNL